jgi:hypothetical protein
VVSVGGGVETEGGLAFTMLRWQPVAQRTIAESASAHIRQPIAARRG